MKQKQPQKKYNGDLEGLVWLVRIVLLLCTLFVMYAMTRGL